MSQISHDFASSGAFVEACELKPYKSGVLDGLTFAVKDNIDIAGYKTSYGSKAWASVHENAVYNALCIEQLLSAGANCIGKTVADEFTYSLDGESHFFGTPVNPSVPDRIPGGSSSGSASAVACGLVDFSVGTDAAGSIRVPASLCGIWGMRPTLNRISEAGVLPFMPGVSTVGAFANDASILDKVMRTLLRSENSEAMEIRNIYILEDAFTVADKSVRDAIRQVISDLSTSTINIADIAGDDIDLQVFNRQALRILQTAEFMNTVGSWVETFHPEKSLRFTAAYENAQSSNRSELYTAQLLCEKLFKRLLNFTRKGDLFVFPTTPTIAPLKGALDNPDIGADFYNRTMDITSFTGIGRMPEISIPVATVNNAPVGLSLVAGYYQDEFLLSAAAQLFPSYSSGHS